MLKKKKKGLGSRLRGWNRSFVEEVEDVSDPRIESG